MAGIKVTGLDELRRNIQRITTVDGIRAMEEAQTAAAEVIKNAVSASAPRGKTGKLFRSIKIFKSKPKGLTTSAKTAVLRMLIGPEKKTGYYGYFLAKGWKSSGSRRRKRTATASTHSQRGLATSRTIPAPYPEWVAKAGLSAEEQAKATWINTYKNRFSKLGAL